MVLQRIVFIFLLVVLLSACSKHSPNSADVYQALFSYLDKNERTYYIRENPVALPDQELSGDIKQLYSSFRFPQSKQTHSAEEFGSLRIQLVSEKEYSKIFSGGCESGWRQFHKQYPKAKSLLQISKIGYRSNNTEALVYMSGGAGCLAGSGYIFILKKSSTGWILSQEFNLWVA